MRKDDSSKRWNLPLINCFLWTILSIAMAFLTVFLRLIGFERPDFDIVYFLAIGGIGIAVMMFMSEVRETLARLENREPAGRSQTIVD